MIINCGQRRIIRNRYGYMIQIRHALSKGKRKGETDWQEDRPAFPASLAQALDMVYERTLADQNDDVDVRDLPAACERAAKVAIACSLAARAAGDKLEADNAEL